MRLRLFALYRHFVVTTAKAHTVNPHLQANRHHDVDAFLASRRIRLTFFLGRRRNRKRKRRRAESKSNERKCKQS